MFKWLVLVIFLNGVSTNELKTIDGYFTSLFKLGDPRSLFETSLTYFYTLCDAPPPTEFIMQTRSLFNRTFGDSKMTIEATEILLEPFVNSDLPICKMINKFNMGKAREFTRKIDALVNEAKVCRDQLMSAMAYSSLPNTNATVGILKCHAFQWAKCTMEIFPEADGLRDFVKEYISLIITNKMDNWIEKNGVKPVSICQFPVSYPEQNYNSPQLAILFAVYNLSKKNAL